jgi:hypothetical protein
MSLPVMDRCGIRMVPAHCLAQYVRGGEVVQSSAQMSPVHAHDPI